MYDKSLSIFSPEGTLSQVEYALEAVKKGGLSIGMIGKKCIILAAERKAVPKLQDQRTIKKINRIDSHIAMAFSGKYEYDSRQSYLIIFSYPNSTDFEAVLSDNVKSFTNYLINYICSTSSKACSKYQSCSKSIDDSSEYCR